MIEARNLKKSFIRNINTTNEKKSFLSSKKTKEEFFAVNDISQATPSCTTGFLPERCFLCLPIFMVLKKKRVLKR